MAKEVSRATIDYICIGKLKIDPKIFRKSTVKHQKKWKMR